MEESTKEALRKQLIELDPVTLLHGFCYKTICARSTEPRRSWKRTRAAEPERVLGEAA